MHFPQLNLISKYQNTNKTYIPFSSNSNFFYKKDHSASMIKTISTEAAFDDKIPILTTSSLVESIIKSPNLLFYLEHDDGMT